MHFLSGKIDVVLLSFTGEAEDYEKGVYDFGLFPNIYCSECLFTSLYEILHGKSLVPFYTKSLKPSQTLKRLTF